ncbi:MAG: hypothetical protein AAB551_00120 [Patescibacteria group bacterium]
MIAPASRTLEEAVLGTLAFFDLFDRPLTVHEITQYLFGFQASDDEISAYLSHSPLVSSHDEYFSLKDREVIFPSFFSRREINKNLWKKVWKFSFLFRFIPFLKEVSVCNRLAYQAATEKSDIDLFIVSQRNRLFLCRTFLLFFLGIFGVRLHGNKITGRFCLSFLVSQDYVNMDAMALQPFDVYLFFWQKTLRPIHFEKSFFARFFEFLLKGKFGDFVERRLQIWQISRARRKWQELGQPSGVVITPDVLKFHHPDMRSTYRDLWEKTISTFSSRYTS